MMETCAGHSAPRDPEPNPPMLPPARPVYYLTEKDRQRLLSFAEVVKDLSPNEEIGPMGQEVLIFMFREILENLEKVQ